jgi:hypothetical protein
MTVVGVGSDEDRFDEEIARTRGISIGKKSEKRGAGSRRGSVVNGLGDGGWNGLGIMVTNEMSVTSDRIA